MFENAEEFRELIIESGGRSLEGFLQDMISLTERMLKYPETHIKRSTEGVKTFHGYLEELIPEEKELLEKLEENIRKVEDGVVEGEIDTNSVEYNYKCMTCLATSPKAGFEKEESCWEDGKAQCDWKKME